MARLLVCPITRVYPSGADLAAASTPMLPPAPGLLSTTTVHLFISVSFCATTRDMMSVPPAGGNGTISLIGLLGYSCATAAADSRKRATGSRRRSMGILKWGQTPISGTLSLPAVHPASPSYREIGITP